MKIILAIDGSHFGDGALEYLNRLLGPHEDAEIMVLSVIERLEPIVAGAASGSGTYYTGLQNVSFEQANNIVESAVSRLVKCFAGHRFDIRPKVVKGSVSREIVRIAEGWGADLVVVGSHGYGYWERTLLGSVSDAVVHLAPCSVLVVREGV